MKVFVTESNICDLESKIRTVAWSASHLWAACLVRYKQMDLMDAIAHAKEITFGTLALEGFLCEKLQISF